MALAISARCLDWLMIQARLVQALIRSKKTRLLNHPKEPSTGKTVRAREGVSVPAPGLKRLSALEATTVM